MQYLKLPLRLQNYFDRTSLSTEDLKLSISFNLHLLITTSVDESKMDFKYGASFWDQDYDIHVSDSQRKELIEASIKYQIRHYEKRLINPIVRVQISQISIRREGKTRIHKEISIDINASLAVNKTPFPYKTKFLIGPLSFDTDKKEQGL